jgi:hypothetical protein
MEVKKDKKLVTGNKYRTRIADGFKQPLKEA